MAGLFWCFSPTVIKYGWCQILAVFLISCYILVPFGYSLEPQQITNTYSIYSADITSTIHGEFFLGSGEVESEFVYVYYTGNNQTGYKLGDVPSGESTIFMDENTSPYIKETYTHEINGANDNISYEIHVPPGSIVEQYNMGVNK